MGEWDWGVHRAYPNMVHWGVPGGRAQPGYRAAAAPVSAGVDGPGDYGIVDEIRDDQLLIVVVAVADRWEVYRWPSVGGSGSGMAVLRSRLTPARGHPQVVAIRVHEPEVLESPSAVAERLNLPTMPLRLLVGKGVCSVDIVHLDNDFDSNAARAGEMTGVEVVSWGKFRVVLHADGHGTGVQHHVAIGGPAHWWPET